MIGRIWMVAVRDLMATLTNKAFLFGLILTPALLLLGFTVVPRLLNSAAAPQVKGEIALIDQSGQVLPALRTALDPQAIATRRDKGLSQLAEEGVVPPPVAWVPPQLTLHELPGGTDAGKSWLLERTAAGVQHLALTVIPAQAVTLDGKSDYGAYELYVAKNVTEDTQLAIHGAVRDALVSIRMKAKGVDRDSVERMQSVARPTAVVVAPEGEQPSQGTLRRILPFICGLLLFLTVVMGGSTLMGSTIEEKSSRVMEVLLAAVSPLELMAGKLLAQLAVGLMMLTVYVGFGLVALAGAAAAGVIEPMLVVDLVVLFLLAYLTYGALMMTIGAAVSSNADAGPLMMPVMMLLVIPYVMTVFVGQAPNAPLAVIMSFVPPFNTFMMLARLASDAPPPFWQVPLTVGIGLLFAAGVLWFAAKVFKIALLMHGKPPSLATLVRWAWMA